MICPPCSKAASDPGPGWSWAEELEWRRALHDKCEYGETCTCQHHVLDKPLSP